MIRVNDIKEGLSHLVGWQQSQDVVIDNSLTESKSGLYFQQANPLLTLANIKNIAPDFTKISVEDYDVSEKYLVGTYCVYKDKDYISIKDSEGKIPEEPESIEYWKKIDRFSDWLEKKTQGSIIHAIASIVNMKFLDGAVTLLENKYLFDGTGRIIDTVINENALVGFELVPIRSKGVTLQLNKIGLQFNEIGPIKLYIMHSSSSVPIHILELVKTKANSMEWFVLPEIYLPYISNETDAGGSWYIVYEQSALGNTKAIGKERDWSKGPCNACSRADYLAWQGWSKYLEVHPFKVNNNAIEHAEGNICMWDIANNLYTYTTNYGLNLEVSVACDITDFILEQKHLFSQIILKQVAVDLLKEMAYNPNARINRNAISISKADILFELQGDITSYKKSGLLHELTNAYNALNLETRGLDRVCLPCKSKGIRYRSI